MAKEQQEEKKKENDERYKLTEVITATEPAILDSKDGQAYSQLQMLCKIANDVEAIRKTMG